MRSTFLPLTMLVSTAATQLAACGSSATSQATAPSPPAGAGGAGAAEQPAASPGPALAAKAPPSAGDRLDDDTRAIIGRPAPGWRLERWINSPPLTLESLRGSVVLVRWFMSPECPFCSATAPSLNRLHALYKDRGLVVVGMYHHKRPEPLTTEDVRSYVGHFGFQFPVAIDEAWGTLKRWWLDGHDRRWTSVSFLLDRRGIVRYVHLGGRYAPEDPDYETVRAKIEDLLAEPAE